MTLKNINENLVVSAVDVKDIRWPTSLGGHGSDAMVRYYPVNYYYFLSTYLFPSRRMLALRIAFTIYEVFYFVFVKQHTDPDYSCAYVTVKTNSHAEGYGLTFTCGRGTEIVAIAVKALRSLVVERKLRADIYARFGEFWRELTSESQLRWVIGFRVYISRHNENYKICIIHWADWTGKGCHAFGRCGHCECTLGSMGPSRK